MSTHPVQPDCIFCKLATDPGAVIWENQHFVALNDIKPKADTHILIIPKHHLENLNQATADVAAGLIEATQLVAREKGVDDGYKVVINTGRKGGQEVDHLHLHLLAGAVKHP